MDAIIWQNDHKEDEFNFAVMRLYGLAQSWRKIEGTQKAGSFHVVFYINQDGWQERKVPKESKEDFKEYIMKDWHKKLPQLPKPFTGMMKVHCHDLMIYRVEFNPKQ